MCRKRGRCRSRSTSRAARSPLAARSRSSSVSALGVAMEQVVLYCQCARNGKLVAGNLTEFTRSQSKSLGGLGF